MAGKGSRIANAGYKKPKPLIEINGIHMIGHVINLFPNEEDIIFICNEEHLNKTSYAMEKIIYKYCKSAKIIPIKPHRFGPGHAVLKAKKEYEKIRDNNFKEYSNFLRSISRGGTIGITAAEFDPNAMQMKMDLDQEEKKYLSDINNLQKKVDLYNDIAEKLLQV